MSSIYKKKHLRIKHGIPVFSSDDFYTKNYQQISKDHVTHYEKYKKNPFMDPDYVKGLNSFTKTIVNKFLNKLNKNKKKLKILDVGVGMGDILATFNNCEKYGNDISFDYLKIAKKRGINCCFSKIENLPYKKNIFDIILCFDVLEHVFDLNVAIKKIVSSLKPDGYLIIRVPYKENLESYFYEDYPYEYVHLRNFDDLFNF